ncbi:MAG: Asp23/Gls24 family envelope stress response protein [Christensenellaceae bacterium]|jgi:uncharacterized alkaline shock family protein YloU|nr:Asp23/Gls24 family envelope stress response protein [Christensenellaceae bacterium]
MARRFKTQTIDRCTNIISSIANAAVTKTDGVSLDLGLVKYKFGLSAAKNKNTMVYVDEDDTVIIDMYINVLFGHSIPDVVCNLQETIKFEVEEFTSFKINKINVHVMSVLFN